MQRLRGKLTYSNVMVTVLAFVVLGGGTASPPRTWGRKASAPGS